jgi:PKD repeat protein
MLFTVRHLNAQECDIQAEFTVMVENGNLDFQASDPNVPNATYTWAWTDDNGGSGGGNGITYSIPVPPLPTNVTMVLTVTNEFNEYTCSRIVQVLSICGEVAGFTAEEIGDCMIQFTPSMISGVTSHTWTFGDGSPDSHDIYPEYVYGQSGTYNVCHAVVIPLPTGEYKVVFCCQDVTVNCSTGGGETVKVIAECCRLNACFSGPNPTGSTHTWDFGDGQSSTDPPPVCHYYTNLSTYPAPAGTPVVTVTHCVTLNGTTTCNTLAANLVTPPTPAAIYVGEPGVSTPISVVSSVDGQELFPGNLLQGPYLQDPLTPLEVHVAGEFRISKSFTFQNDVNFCMDPCASMSVPHHRHLTFDDNIVVDNLDGCGLWRSIDLDYQSHFTSSNQVNIESSLYGIRTGNYNSVISLSDTRFVDNWVSMLLTRPFTLTRFDRNLFDNTDLLDPVPFLWFSPCYIPLPEPTPFTQLQAFAGIVTDNVTLNIPDMNNPPPGDLGESVFSNLANGIVMLNSHGNIQRCRFLNITDDVYGSLGGNGIRFRDNIGSHTLRQWGIGLNNLPTFDNCVTGIHVYSDNAINTLVQSQDNIMANMIFGYHFDDITGSLAGGSIVKNNDITASNRGVWVELNAPEFSISHLNIASNQVTNDGDESIGILLDDATPLPVTAMQDIKVIYNNVDLIEGRSGIETLNFRGALISQKNNVNVNDVSPSPNLPFPPIGIYLNGGRQNTVNCLNTVTGQYPGSNAAQHSIITDFSADNTITDNTFQNTRLGIQFRNPCGTQTWLGCNTMQNHEAGLDYWATAVTGHQGPNGTSRGNQWLGSWPFGTVGARHQSTDPSTIQASLYNAKIGSNQWPPSIEVVTTPIPWFSNGPSFYCPPPACLQAEPPVDSLNLTDTTIVNSGGLLPADEAALNREIRRYLYGKLAENPGLLASNSLMQGFMSDYGNDPEGLLYNTGQQAGNLFALDTGTVQLLEDNFNTIQAALAEIITIDSTLAADSIWTTADSLLLLSRQQWEDTIDVKGQSNEQINAQWLANRTAGAASVIASNNAITTDSIYDENEKTLLGIYLNTVVKSLPPTLVQKALIEGIAKQCPEVGGYSTYWARAWHSILTGVLIAPLGCEGVEERSQSEWPETDLKLTEARFSLFPNPAQQDVTIEYSLPADWEHPRLVISSIAGIAVAEYYVDPAISTLKLPVGDLPNGIYFLQIASGNKKTGVQNLIIIK